MEYEILKFGIYAPVSSNMYFLSGGVSIMAQMSSQPRPHCSKQQCAA